MRALKKKLKTNTQICQQQARSQYEANRSSPLLYVFSKFSSNQPQQQRKRQMNLLKCILRLFYTTSLEPA